MRNINNRQKLFVTPRERAASRDPIARLLPKFKPRIVPEAPLLRSRVKYTRKGRQAVGAQ
jgi:hypothetical protein